jgi:hypothetical protein
VLAVCAWPSVTDAQKSSTTVQDERNRGGFMWYLL